MAQQLTTMSTPAAYDGVTKYAHGPTPATRLKQLTWRWATHTCSTGAMRRLLTALRQARQSGDVLADYADFLAAQADHETGNEAAADVLLHGFAAAPSRQHLRCPGTGDGGKRVAGQ